jgi:hypothetical protein
MTSTTTTTKTKHNVDHAGGAMCMYSQEKITFPLSIAILERDVKVRFLVNDHASHSYLMLEALKSLKSDMAKQDKRANVESKMFKVCAACFFYLSKLRVSKVP